MYYFTFNTVDPKSFKAYSISYSIIMVNCVDYLRPSRAALSVAVNHIGLNESPLNSLAQDVQLAWCSLRLMVTETLPFTAGGLRRRHPGEEATQYGCSSERWTKTWAICTYVCRKLFHIKDVFERPVLLTQCTRAPTHACRMFKWNEFKSGRNWGVDELKLWWERAVEMNFET